VRKNGLIRIFPRCTRATPDDERAFVGEPPLWTPEPNEVHVSCTFTWDKPRAEQLVRHAQQRWPCAAVKLGGPAYNSPAEEFEPGLYVKKGYVFTSRGCPNRCPRCLVPQREGGIRLLKIKDGFDVLDNNLLACGETHLNAVIEMLRRQPQRARFTGGLEAQRFSVHVASVMLSIKPAVMFFAYDRHGEWPHLQEAVSTIRRLTDWSTGTIRHRVGVYVLVGYEGDTVEDAERRIGQVISLGPRAYPMFFRDENYTRRPPEWHDLIGGTMSFGGK
jgi:hypothetical protein